MLRLAVGAHFFDEGLSKLRGGDFSAAPFLRAATGPAAPLLRRMLDDPEHERLLCIRRGGEGIAPEAITLDPSLTIAIWNDFADRCIAMSGPTSRGQSPPDRGAPARPAVDEERKEQARRLVAAHVDELNNWLATHRAELVMHFSTAGRETAFERDSLAGPRIAAEVDSLRDQTGQIRQERLRTAGAWAAEVNGMWDSLETALLALTPASPSASGGLAIHRPHDQPGSPLKWINQVIPWFDLVVGILLLAGLFSRWAAAGAALLLVSVIAAQPPWVPGAAPVWYQLVELAAALVLASSLARWVPGLDWLRVWRRPDARQPEPVS
jgi:uncharacterized membrane protein YphA (DoxX/SURF4 family)